MPRHNLGFGGGPIRPEAQRPAKAKIRLRRKASIENAVFARLLLRRVVNRSYAWLLVFSTVLTSGREDLSQAGVLESAGPALSCGESAKRD
jgi:hypothetical protein